MNTYKVQVGDDGRVHYLGTSEADARCAAIDLSNVRLGKARVKVLDERSATLRTEHYEWGEKVTAGGCSCVPYHLVGCSHHADSWSER